MTRLQFRDDLAPTGAWVVAGIGWTVQLFLSWTSSGMFSAASQVEAVRLIRSGVVSAIVPTWTAYLLLVLPAVGLLALALSAVAGRVAQVVRAALAVVGTVLVVLTAVQLTDADLGRLGAGALVALVGVLAAAAGLLLDLLAGRPTPSAPLPVPPHHPSQEAR